MDNLPPSPMIARRAAPLGGRLRVPGDKSISHRALIFGARALGAIVERIGDGAWRVEGVGVGGFCAPTAALDFGNSGTGCRLVMGAAAGCPITATFDGDGSLRKRPMRRVLDPLERMGARAL